MGIGMFCSFKISSLGKTEYYDSVKKTLSQTYSVIRHNVLIVHNHVSSAIEVC